MSTNRIVSIDALPVEILHQIFDNLDSETIVFSIRSVSRLFESVVSTYDRYILNFTLMAKQSFVILCRLIHPENITSLTLSNHKVTPNQIDLFISLVCLSKFTQLRSLTLDYINECELYIILKHINHSCLTSLSFTIKEYDNSCMETTANIMSSIIENSSLRELKVTLNNTHVSKISWPINSTIQYLTINSNILIGNLCKILQYCPHLHTLAAKPTFDKNFDNTSLKSFPQLKSLSMDHLGVRTDDLQPFLLLTPSLIYLKIIECREILNANRWEQFIQIHLPHLNKFEFYFEHCNLMERTTAEIELIIDSFRTPFWMEHKKWFIICEYSLDGSHILLYSIPICLSYLTYRQQYKKVVLTSSYTILQDDATINDNINSLTLSLNPWLIDDLQEKKITTEVSLFPKVTKINLESRYEWHLHSMQVLSVFINFSQIVELNWDFINYKKYEKQSIINLNIILEQTHNLSFLFVCYYSASSQAINNLCSIVPPNVKHLKMPIDNLKQIKTIIERCQNLSTVQFNFRNVELSEGVLEWFADNTINSTCINTSREINIWLGKRNIQPDKTRHINKRWKLFRMCYSS